jgi:hypothetical protein
MPGLMASTPPVSMADDVPPAGQWTAMVVQGLAGTGSAYAKAGRLVKLPAPVGDSHFDFGDARLLARMWYPNGIRARYACDPAGRVTALEYLKADATQGIRQETVYDEAGNVSIATGREGVHEFTDDEPGRLTSTTQAILRGATVEPDREYTVATTEYVAAHQHEIETRGLEFPEVGRVLRDIVIQWVEARRVIE